MDRIFDRLTDLLRSMGQPDSRSAFGDSDPDTAAAWDELDDYLSSAEGTVGSTSSSDRAGHSRTTRHDRTGPYRTGPHGRSEPVPGSLRKDFANLDLQFGASLEAARAAHRKLIRAYHPDRHAANPDKYRIATQITQRVNHSYQRIKQFYENGVRPEDHGG